MYVGVDPNGGGAGSEFAMVAVTLHRGKWVLLHITAVPAGNPREVNEAITAHIEYVRGIPHCATAELFFFIENNLAYEADHIRHHIERTAKWVGFGREANSTGVRTTNKSKCSMVADMVEVLSSQRLVLHERIGAAQVKKLAKQLRQFSRVYSKTFAVSYTGKHRGPDDLTMALLIVMHHAKKDAARTLQLRTT